MLPVNQRYSCPLEQFVLLIDLTISGSELALMVLVVSLVDTSRLAAPSI